MVKLLAVQLILIKIHKVGRVVLIIKLNGNLIINLMMGCLTIVYKQVKKL